MTITPTRAPNFEGYVMAVQRVAALLRKVTGALDAAGIAHAMAGDAAVAARVASVDEDAVRRHRSRPGCCEPVTGVRV
ncbi:MAG: hypothetical protein IPM13_02730 [Phycisphaerales bacterium]|nr:hypothetical protein [Phycisphaerales bacterium]